MITVRRSADRFVTSGEGVSSRHSFSFGTHYDPADVGFAVLVAHNDDVVAPGAGYDTHPHSDTEIVTWVLSGSLRHQDSEGRDGVVHPGLVQRLSAGRGVLHSEHAGESSGRSTPSGRSGPSGRSSLSRPEPTRFVQMWLRPDEPGLDPSYALEPVGPLSGLVPVVSGVRGLDATVSIHTSGAALHVARLSVGESVVAPDAAHLHVFVASGAVDVEGAGLLRDGDAARFTAEGGPRVTATEDAEVLVWELPQRHDP